MTGDLDAGAPDKANRDTSPRVVLTVRLYGRGHELLIAEFENLGRRRRAARAAQLMMVGLMYEHAHSRPAAGSPGARSPQILPCANGGGDFGLAPEADTFVSAILHAGASSQG
jgi:hypothetical protein